MFQSDELDFNPDAEQSEEHGDVGESFLADTFEARNSGSSTKTEVARIETPQSEKLNQAEILEAIEKRAEAEKKVEWATNLSDGFRRAMAEGKPLVIVFGADWCDKCVMLKKEVLGMPKDPTKPDSKEVPASREFNTFHDRAIFVHADPDKDDRFGNIAQKMRELNIDSFPTLVVLEVPSMQERARVTGRWEKSTYIEKMSQAFNGKSDAPVRRPGDTALVRDARPVASA